MKRRFELIFLLLFSICSFAQNETVKVYDWEVVIAANPDTIYGVSFSKLKMDSVPATLEKYKALKIINLEKNKLTDLPDFFRDFNNLEELNISKNKFDHFPIELCAIVSLRKLILNRNEIEYIPECISGIQYLEYLDLYDNPIRSLPESLVHLKQLKKIDFSGIRFSPTFQKSWKQKLPSVVLVFDPPCDCME